MDFNKVNEANKAGENTPAASNINTDKQVIPPRPIVTGKQIGRAHV